MERFLNTWLNVAIVMSAVILFLSGLLLLVVIAIDFLSEYISRAFLVGGLLYTGFTLMAALILHDWEEENDD